MPKKTAAADSLDFERALGELKKIVRRMEQGEQPLEEMLKDYERGMTLWAQCRERLDAAQQRVEQLVEKHGAHELEESESDDDEQDDDEI